MKSHETMTIERLRSNFAGLACSFGLLATLVGCSGSDPDPGSPNGTGGGSDSGGSAGTTPGGSAGTSAGGSTGATGGSSAIPGLVVGSFQVEMSAPEDTPDTLRTSVLGKVNGGATPPTIIWETTKTDGECWLEVPRVPFCSDGCGADVCVDDDVCMAYPEGHSVGEVKLSGLKLVGGGSDLTLKEIAKAYQPAAGVMFEAPPFAEGDAIKLTAAGGDFAAFELTTGGVAPLEITSTDFELKEDQSLELQWQAAADQKSSVVHVKIDISHHGGTRGLIECDAADDGTLTISAALVTELLGLGFAGFPSLVATRSSRDGTQIAPGRVELVVSSKAQRAVTIDGLTSCTGAEPGAGDPPECPDGTTCQTDFTCQ
jgi:hypothetical protein